MAFERILNRIREIKQTLINDRENEVLRIAFDQLALTKLRIQTKGQNSAEQAFAPYTEQYKKSRGKAGYQVGYVDFTRTGRLWANVQPRIIASDIFSATVEIAGQEQRSKDIIAGARKKRGNILEPSQAEKEIVRLANRKRILKAFGI